jgi:anti-anti-sigma factor
VTETTRIGSSKIEATVSGSVAIWAPEGRVDAASAPDLEEAMTASIAEGVSDVVLDLNRTRYMSSAGLRVVLVVARALQAKNGRFAVCGLNDEVKELFEVSGFSLIVNIVADRDAAVAAVQQGG